METNNMKFDLHKINGACNSYIALFRRHQSKKQSVSDAILFWKIIYDEQDENNVHNRSIYCRYDDNAKTDN